MSTFRRLISPLCVIVFLSSQLLSSAQTKISEFGIFSQDEFNLKECPFDKTADALLLFDQALSNYNDQYNLVTDRRIRLKILKESGIERGNIHIRFYNRDKFEFIGRINAVIATPGANKEITWGKLEQKSVYTRKINDVWSEMVFAMPNVKVGSIIEYRYTSTMEHYGGLQDWYFQDEIPTVLSSYKLYILPNTSFNYVIRKSNFMNVDVQPDNSSGSILFEMKNVPGLRDEAYSTSYRNYLQRVNFQLSSIRRGGAEMKYSNNWKELNKEFLDSREFGAQINKSISTPADALAVTYTDPFRKMQFIHNYVRKNFQWNKEYDLYANSSLKSVVDKKSGSAADLNLLLVNMLKDADFNVYPLLVSERWHGYIDTTLSFQDQFDKVVALVYIDGKKYVLDATDPVTPSNMVPRDLVNTVGFVVDKKNSGFVYLTDKTKKKTSLVEVKGNLNDAGLISGSAKVDYYDYARIGKAEEYSSNKEKYLSKFTGGIAGLKIDSVKVDGIQTDSTSLHHEFLLEYPAGKSGSYSMLNYNLFTGFEKNPFISDYRFTDIDFVTPSLFILSGSFQVPGSFKVDALPKDITLRTPDKGLQIVRQMKKTGNTINVDIKFEIINTFYAADDYPMIKDFFGKMIDVLNEPILLKAN
jgi:hypothetical protein